MWYPWNKLSKKKGNRVKYNSATLLLFCFIDLCYIGSSTVLILYCLSRVKRKTKYFVILSFYFLFIWSFSVLMSLCLFLCILSFIIVNDLFVCKHVYLSIKYVNLSTAHSFVYNYKCFMYSFVEIVKYLIKF